MLLYGTTICFFFGHYPSYFSKCFVSILLITFFEFLRKKEKERGREREKEREREGERERGGYFFGFAAFTAQLAGGEAKSF